MPTHSTYSSSVDVATGAVLSYGFDFYLNGVIPLEIERLWFSDSDFSGRLGYGVHSIFDVQLKIDEESTWRNLSQHRWANGSALHRWGRVLYLESHGYRRGVEHIEANTRNIDEASFTRENIDRLGNHLSREQFLQEADMTLYNADLNRY